MLADFIRKTYKVKSNKRKNVKMMVKTNKKALSQTKQGSSQYWANISLMGIIFKHERQNPSIILLWLLFAHLSLSGKKIIVLQRLSDLSNAKSSPIQKSLCNGLCDNPIVWNYIISVFQSIYILFSSRK